jgi:hypothetical protein
MSFPVFIGYSAHEREAWRVAKDSLLYTTQLPVDVQPLYYRMIPSLYWRRTVMRQAEALRSGRLWDVVSDAPMSTDHAIARFFIPQMLPAKGWALFTDGDVLFRRGIAELVKLAHPQYAVMVVQHDYTPQTPTKKDGDPQLPYARKNWSSVMLWNLEHPAHQKLTLTALNSLPGRDLHRFCWLDDSQIGRLPEEWNWLAGHSSPDLDPAIVHYTEGVPDVIGYEDAPYADEWRAHRECPSECM